MNYLLILCALAVGHGIFISIALLVMSRRLSNKLLALLLVLLAIRVGKSVVQLFLQPDMSYTTSVIGVTAMAAIGPALFLLMRSFFNTAFGVKPSHYIHFIPSALLPLTLFTNWKLLAPVYYFFTAHVLVYASVCWLITLKNSEVYKTDDVKWKWSLMVLTATTILGFTFVLQVTVYQPIVYATNVIVAALIFYGLSLWAIKRSRLFLPEPPAKSENSEVLDDLGKRIKILLETNESFTDSTLSVSSLAARLKSPPYLISRAVNHYFRKSFSELLVDYRIKKAEQLLLSPSGKVYTIEAVAFESGFNTLSAFYASFKKINGITPAQFREARRA